MWQGDVRYETCKDHVFYRSAEWVEKYVQRKHAEVALRPKEEQPKPVIGKICYKCLEDKPLTEFHRNANKSDGVASLCIPCARKKNVLYNTKVSGRRAISGYKTRLTEGAKYDPRCESSVTR